MYEITFTGRNGPIAYRIFDTIDAAINWLYKLYPTPIS